MTPPLTIIPAEPEHRPYFNLDLVDDDWDD
jgi:hypothetical protein